ncbi:MAG: cytochrome c family protein [Rhodobacteraceae bacterium]|nr:cytochrome c family protein [Paracoccaceae bacterium]
MDTMDLTKIFGALCGSLLFLLLVNWASGAIYEPGGGHGNGSYEAAYVIEVEEEETVTVDADGPDLLELIAAADVGRGKRVFTKCKACHKLEDGGISTGPHLYNVIGRPVASVGEFAYSGALQTLSGEWGYEELDKFLTRPSDFVPGTNMSFVGLKKPKDRANVIAYLESLRQ